MGDPPGPAPECAYDPAALVDERGAPALAARIVGCYGRAAGRIPVGGDTLDRLTLLSRLGETDDRDTRRRLFLALAPVWQAVNGGGSATSPWRTLLRSRAERWRAEPLPHVQRSRALGVPPDSAAIWLERVLEAWRAAQPDTLLEPWDWHHFVGAADRRLSPRIPRDRLLSINHAWFRALGADPALLRIEYDIGPRLGKYPVAYTTFGDRPYRTRDGWWPGAPAVFATYRTGGFGNLVELLHETGHGIHIAGIRTRAAFADWPDSDTFSEAVADLAAHDAYEPRWQMAILGDSVRLADGLRAKYGGVVLDVAWAYFEMRMFQAPDQDPNRVWSEITHRYLAIQPHPEWSWWAMRGQLIDSPGYMLNYALGAMVTAGLRSRIREVRGSWTEGDAGWYPWVRDRLFGPGKSTPAAGLLRDFLGQPPGPAALLADLARAAPRPPLRTPR